MKKITIPMIRSWGPCYDPNRYLPENFKGTVLDILDNKEIPFEDRLWVILRNDLVSEKFMRIFAVWCARQVQHLMKDQRSLDALDFMEAYIENYWLIDDPEWKEGWEELRDAAWDAARNVAWIEWDTAWVAAWTAANDAARGVQEAKLREMLIEGAKTGEVF